MRPMPRSAGGTQGSSISLSSFSSDFLSSLFPVRSSIFSVLFFSCFGTGTLSYYAIGLLIDSSFSNKVALFLVSFPDNFSSSAMSLATFLSASDCPFFFALTPSLIYSSSINSFSSLSRYSSLSESTALPYLSFNF